MSASESDSYYYIAMHYKFGLSKIFDELEYDKAIVLEGFYFFVEIPISHFTT